MYSIICVLMQERDRLMVPVHEALILHKINLKTTLLRLPTYSSRLHSCDTRSSTVLTTFKVLSEEEVPCTIIIISSWRT